MSDEVTRLEKKLAEVRRAALDHGADLVRRGKRLAGVLEQIRDGACDLKTARQLAREVLEETGFTSESGVCSHDR